MLIVGAVLSKVTAVAFVVVETVAPAFPARSLKAIENPTVPVASPVTIIQVALQLVGPPLTVAACVAINTVGVPILSDDVKVNVTVSPTFAQALFALFDWMETGLRVGAVLSKVTSVLETVVATLPAASVASKANV